LEISQARSRVPDGSPMTTPSWYWVRAKVNGSRNWTTTSGWSGSAPSVT
jgi:hypothetical protein